MGRYGLPFDVIDTGTKDANSSIPTLYQAVQQAELERKQQAATLQNDPYLLIMEGYTSEWIEEDPRDLQWEQGNTLISDELEDRIKWAEQQAELEQSWRTEDAQVIEEAQAVARRVQERMRRKAEDYERAAHEQQQQRKAKADHDHRQRLLQEQKDREERERAEAAAREQAERAKQAREAAEERRKAAEAAQPRTGLGTASLASPQPPPEGSNAVSCAPPTATESSGEASKSQGSKNGGAAPQPPSAGPSSSPSSPAPDCLVSPNAWEEHQKLKAGLEALTSSNPEYVAWAASQRSLKLTQRETRTISRSLNAIINGLAGTVEDVMDKSERVCSEISSRSGPARTEAILQFARKVVNQCADMVAQSPQYAWPLAALLREVSTRVPELSDVFLACMQGGDSGCPLCVPMFSPAPSATHHSRDSKLLNGYRDDETEEDFTARLGGTLRLLGAYYATTAPQRAWAFTAALLNHIPPSSTSAAALIAFLSCAGHRLMACYSRQTSKLLLYIEEFWLPELERAGKHTGADRAQLKGLCQSGFRDVPEGSQFAQALQDSEQVDRDEYQSARRPGGRSRHPGSRF